ncbi:hypothetical protein GIB67_012055 [Kingdonia uniflora]|uniref:Uncharacterized protein n=1 Tax=Kingdonia uniflora TaxID=39325 RepID=A0A7J7M0E5_9MAGN|nr:hypothetical protein GIB67_012055 [Kingdonia uniflora]
MAEVIAEIPEIATITTTEEKTMDIVPDETRSNEVDTNGDGKRSREEEEGENADASKKQRVEKCVDEERQEAKESANLGPKKFSSAVEMFDYFYKFLHYWPTNVDINKYELTVFLDLVKKGCPEPEKKVGGGIRSFQVRHHPVWKSRCFFLVRKDDSVDDFSFRKCVDNILSLPEELKIKPDANKALGGRGGGARVGKSSRGRGRGGRN